MLPAIRFGGGMSLIFRDGQAFFLTEENDEVGEEVDRTFVIDSFIQPIGPEMRFRSLQKSQSRI